MPYKIITTQDIVVKNFLAIFNLCDKVTLQVGKSVIQCAYKVMMEEVRCYGNRRVAKAYFTRLS